MRFNNSFKRDALVIVALIIGFNIFMLFAYDSFQYLNTRKIVAFFIMGLFAFVPMYAVLWVTLRKIKSYVWFFIVSWGVWALYPVLMSQGRSKAFNAWQGERQIYENGNLTLYGYFHKLHNPFFFLAAYATVLLVSHIYRNINIKSRGV